MEKQQSKKPLIRFPEFKDAWDQKRLNELLSEAKKRNEDLKYGKDEVLSVSGELGIVNQIEHLGRSYAGVSVHQYHVVEVGDIVYTKSPLKANPFGIIKLNKGKAGIVSTLYAVYKVNQQTAYGPFIDYYFSLDANTNRYLRPLVKKGAKNDMKINNAYVLHDRIFAPTIPEQKRIASFFTVLDKKIAELKQKKNLLEQYKKGIMQKLFSQELRFKDENGKEFPKWEEKKLGEVCECLDNLRKPLNDNERQKLQGKYPYWGANNIMDYINDYIFDETIVLLAEDGGNFNEFKTRPIANIYKGKCWVNNHTHVLRSIKNISVNEFLFYSLVHKDITGFVSGGTRAKLTKGEMLKIPISIPCLEEQTKISSFLSAIDEKINRTENQIQQAQQYKKGILQNMFI
jgi:type I restriction enzyme S subunit